MTDALNDWNARTIEEFHANDGKVGGHLDGQNVLLLHHRGRSSGREYVNPLVYLADPDDASVMYLFGSANGGPKHPQWYRNIVAAGTTDVEVGTETFPVTVADVTGPERDRIYAAQVEVMPGFGDYEKQTEGIRTIPVVRLRRAA